MLTDEQLAEIRKQAKSTGHRFWFNGHDMLRLLAHIDEVTKQRDKAIELLAYAYDYVADEVVFENDQAWLTAHDALQRDVNGDN